MSLAVIPSDAIWVDTSECLGSGAAGVVYKARYGNETVVVKRLKMQSMSRSAEEEFKQEAATLSKLNHPRIVRFLGVVVDNEYSIVLEYLPLGSLYGYYTEQPKLPLNSRISLALDIATGMDFLHKCQPPVWHRDLKSLNILLSQDSSGEIHAKITDFGIAVVMQSTMTATSLTSGSRDESHKGTLIWMAPELHDLRAVFRPACDVYAYGVLLSEIFSWQGPFGIPTAELRFEVLHHMLTVRKQVPDLELDDDVPQSIFSLVGSCISLDQNARPSFESITRNLSAALNGSGQVFQMGAVNPMTLTSTVEYKVTETSVSERTFSADSGISGSGNAYSLASPLPGAQSEYSRFGSNGSQNLSSPVPPSNTPNMAAYNNAVPESVYSNVPEGGYNNAIPPNSTYFEPAAGYSNVPAQNNFSNTPAMGYSNGPLQNGNASQTAGYNSNGPYQNSYASVPATGYSQDTPSAGYSYAPANPQMNAGAPNMPSTNLMTGSGDPSKFASVTVIHEEEPKKTSRLSTTAKIVIGIAIVLVLIGGGVGAYFGTRKSSDGGGGTNSNGQSGAGTTTSAPPVLSSSSSPGIVQPSSTVRRPDVTSSSVVVTSAPEATTSGGTTVATSTVQPSTPGGPPLDPVNAPGNFIVRAYNGRCLTGADTLQDCSGSASQVFTYTTSPFGRHIQNVESGRCIGPSPDFGGWKLGDERCPSGFGVSLNAQSQMTVGLNPSNYGCVSADDFKFK
ncbi:hypothetical protein HDU67_003860 [Dinochytrium kinnereticum]|nr:hypothetical protein HDU67_003860 [Dinochytrium kinnereticum]